MKEYDDGLFYGRPFQQLFQLHNQRISTQVLQLDSVTFCYKFMQLSFGSLVPNGRNSDGDVF